MPCLSIVPIKVFDIFVRQTITLNNNNAFGSFAPILTFKIAYPTDAAHSERIVHTSIYAYLSKYKMQTFNQCALWINSLGSISHAIVQIKWANGKLMVFVFKFNNNIEMSTPISCEWVYVCVCVRANRFIFRAFENWNDYYKLIFKWRTGTQETLSQEHNGRIVSRSHFNWQEEISTRKSNKLLDLCAGDRWWPPLSIIKLYGGT